ncbi:MAG: hypothetical protein VKO44_11850, partial [Cyanobacteriota bacterium]|nr:hypothetical protein [Cyanobacteriota bacterium]
MPLLDPLRQLGEWLVHIDLGLGLLLLVGASMALSHGFALLANRLSGRQILVQLLLDGLLLSVAFLLGLAIDMVLLARFASRPVTPAAVLDGVAPCLLPGTLYALAAAPYVGDWIAAGLWAMVHLNVIAFLHARFALPPAEALLLCTPGWALAAALVGLRFRQRWQASYASLASRLGER